MSSAAEARETVLIVDDEEPQAKLYAGQFQRRGWLAEAVFCGEDAVDATRNREFGVILLDMRMPGMDGFEATAAIRECEKLTGGHIPIVAMTAHALVGDQERCLAAGMDGYVSKPIRTSELFATIERMLSDKRKPESTDLAKSLQPLIKL